MTEYGPIVRIVLRYIVGGVFMGSTVLGEQLAADPDLVAMGALALGGAVEGFYVWAKRRGGAT